MNKLFQSDEESLFKFDKVIIDSLLIDRTTKSNIKWATEEYQKYGDKYSEKSIITVDLITGRHSKIIRPRVMKNKKDQDRRSRLKAEVFTPSWMCNSQNNQIDSLWFENISPFNKELEKGWITNSEKVKFLSDKTWKDYVSDIRLEISCGEAPYLVSVYDTVTGNTIPISDRIGMLDRKIRVINENCSNEEWYDWIKKAFQSVYGFEFQGDNLLIARLNLMRTFVDNYLSKYDKEPSDEMLLEISEIITWNIWQMDGMKCVVPFSCRTDKARQMTLFGEDIETATICLGCESDNMFKHNGVYPKVMDWNLNKKVKYIDLLRVGRHGKN